MIVKPGMSLVVDVVLTGLVPDDGTPAIVAAYVHRESVPRSTDVVDGHGNIDLWNMDFDPRHYVLDTAITFSLIGMIADTDGKEVEFGFPLDPAQAVTIETKANTPNQLTARSSHDPKKVTIDDENNDGETYTYCLGIRLATAAPGGTIVRLDPSIVNRRF